jgi:type IV pilus assembly protein PilM
MLPVSFSPRVTVVDCGASRTALGVFRGAGTKIRLGKYAAESLGPAMGDADAWLENTRAAFQALRVRVKPAGPLVLVLPPHLVLTKFLKIPRVGPAKRERVIRFEASQYIPYALDEVAWESTVAGECGTELEVMLAVAKLEVVEPLCDAAQAAGFEPRIVLPSPLATLAGFRLVQADQSQTVLVLNIGARSTTLLLVESKRFMARTFSPGGNGLTRQIAADNDCNVVEALATRLAQEITRSVLYFRRQSDMEPPSCVHLTGGAARLAGLAEALAVKLRVPVDRLDVLGSIENIADTSDHALVMTDLIGAAATQLRPSQAVLNLLPPRRRNQQEIRRRQPWLIAATALVMAALIPPLVHVRDVADEAQRKTAAIERKLVPLRERDARNRTNLRQLGELRQEAMQLQGIYERRVSWLSLLSDLQDRLARVEDVWLERLQIMPVAAGAPVKLAISGRMLDRTIPLSKVSPATSNRVKKLLDGIMASPFVSAVEGERFDNNLPGILRFDFVLVADSQHPL